MIKNKSVDYSKSISNTRFADDMLLISDDLDGLQNMLLYVVVSVSYNHGRPRDKRGEK